MCQLATCLILLGVTGAAGAEGDGLVPFDPAQFSQEVTECDRVASHPDDPWRVAPGRTQAEIAENCPAAIAACEKAVEKDPANPRLRYQLARVYGDSGQGEKASPHRHAAVAANYPQAHFVVG